MQELLKDEIIEFDLKEVKSYIENADIGEMLIIDICTRGNNCDEY